MKISTFMIGLIMFSLFIVIGTIYIGQINLYYPLANSSRISEINVTYNKLVELENLSSAVKNKTEDVTAKDSWLDILGGFFGGGYAALKLTATSADTAIFLGDQALKELPLGSSVKWFRIALGAILFIAIFIGIFLSVLTRREL